MRSMVDFKFCQLIAAGSGAFVTTLRAQTPTGAVATVVQLEQAVRFAADRDLLLAYDDPLGVTAAFNKNLLVRVNQELGGEFDLDTFAHRAVWNAQAGRVEMHLVSMARQAVTSSSAISKG